MINVTCQICGAAFDEPGTTPVEERPCPVCGSTKRHWAITFETSIVSRMFLFGSKRRAGLGGWLSKVKLGDSLFRKTGRWHKLYRMIDRENDRYREVITDAETRELIRDVDEPLTEHQGHGDAKQSKHKRKS